MTALSSGSSQSLTSFSYSQKFYKLKRDAEKLLSGDGGGATAAALKTPANKGEKTTPLKSTGGSKRKKADSGDEVEETPTKKKKATVKVEVKNEPDANDTKQPKVEDVEENESGL